MEFVCLELSNMPIADLLQLKESLGAKMYVSYLLGVTEQDFRLTKYLKCFL